MMDTDLGPVVIVVSDDSDSKKASVENGKTIMTTEEEEVRLWRKETNRCNKNISKVNSHNVLCKYNSYPFQDRRYSNNHLRVPSTVSSFDADSSVCSSDESLPRSPEFNSCANCNLVSSADNFSDDGSSYNTVNVDTSQFSISDANNQQCSENKSDPEPFQHKPLTRASSAPLKSNEQLRIPGQNGFLNNIGNSASRFSLLVSPKIWKNATKRVHSAGKPSVSTPSSFSLRRTVSHSLRGWSKENGHFISFPTKNKKKPRQKYRIVEAKTGQRDGLSFEVVGKQGSFLRAKGSILIPDKDTSDTYFNKDCTYVPLPDMWFSSFFAFESVSKPSYFIRLTSHEELVLEKYDGTTDFKEEASFQLTRKPCATCLQVGIQTWAKKESGEFCLGKVISIKDEMVEVKFDEDKTVSYRMSDTGHLVPDIIPCAEDITLGTKVIAQWLSRHKLYPGVVSGIRGGDSYEILFDDGDISREKAFQIRLVRTYFFHVEETKHGSSQNKENFEDKLCTETHCSENDISVHQDYQKGDSYPRLWSTDSNLQSPGMSDVISAGHSPPNIHTSVSNENTYTNSQDKQFTFSPWEIETFSQDSGYHGYGKQNKDKVNPTIENTHSSSNYVYTDDDRYDNITSNKYHPDNNICKKIMRSKSLHDLNHDKMCKLIIRRCKSLSVEYPPSYIKCGTVMIEG